MNKSDKPLAYEAYQTLADSYAANIDTKPHNAYYDRPAMLSLLPDVNGKDVFDVGCGPGAYAEALVDLGANVVAGDVSENMLAHARKRLASAIESENVTLINLDLSRPLDSFSDERFDVVNAPLCLDYIEDWRSLFKEFERILRPGGTFLFSCGHPDFDAEYFKTTAYFEIEQVECEWTGFGEQVVMPSFRRPLQEIIMPVIDAGLQLIQILEPKPTEDFRRSDFFRYKNLMYRPGFLCVAARKPELG